MTFCHPGSSFRNGDPAASPPPRKASRRETVTVKISDHRDFLNGSRPFFILFRTESMTAQRIRGPRVRFPTRIGHAAAQESIRMPALQTSPGEKSAGPFGMSGRTQPADGEAQTIGPSVAARAPIPDSETPMRPARAFQGRPSGYVSPLPRIHRTMMWNKPHHRDGLNGRRPSVERACQGGNLRAMPSAAMMPDRAEPTMPRLFPVPSPATKIPSTLVSRLRSAGKWVSKNLISGA